jgi:hypothetical protein
MPIERRRKTGAELVQEAGRALDIGEQEGEGPDRQCRHGQMVRDGWWFHLH